MDADALDGLLDRAMNAISEEMEKIFGKEDDEETEDIDERIESILFSDMGLSGNSDFDEAEERDRKEGGWSDEDIENDKKNSNPAYRFIQEIKWTEEVTEKAGERAVQETVTGADGTLRIVEKLVPIFRTRHIQKSEQRGIDASPGKFGLRVGFAPQFKEGEDLDLDESWSKNVHFEGQGQMGAIMGQYIFNKMREGAGYALSKPPELRPETVGRPRLLAGIADLPVGREDGHGHSGSSGRRTSGTGLWNSLKKRPLP